MRHPDFVLKTSSNEALKNQKVKGKFVKFQSFLMFKLNFVSEENDSPITVI